MNSPLIFRADASSETGVGHVMRCLALAQAWQDAGGRVICACAELPATLATRLERENILCVPVPAAVGSEADTAFTLNLAAQHEAAWIALDGYRFTPGYSEILRSAGFQVMVVDDMAHLNRYPCDLLLNQNLSADAASYRAKVDTNTALLLGPRYALLRREFRLVAGSRLPAARPARRVLVSFGGGDMENFTLRILSNLAAGTSRGLEVVVLAGAANPHADALRRFAATAPFACEIRVDEENVAAVMASADAAITAAGSTVWELAALRLPALVGAHEENQLAGLAALRDVPAFRAMAVEQLLARDLAAELAVLPAFPETDEFGAGGAERVVAHMKALSVRFAPDLVL